MATSKLQQTPANRSILRATLYLSHSNAPLRYHTDGDRAPLASPGHVMFWSHDMKHIETPFFSYKSIPIMALLAYKSHTNGYNKQWYSLCYVYVLEQWLINHIYMYIVIISPDQPAQALHFIASAQPPPWAAKSPGRSCSSRSSKETHTLIYIYNMYTHIHIYT